MRRIATMIGMTALLLWGLALAVNADELTDAVNLARAQNGLWPLRHDDSLAALASRNNQYGFGHHVFAGLPISRQNSAWGIGSAAGVVDAWLRSPGHRAAILAVDVSVCGGHYDGMCWTLNLGVGSTGNSSATTGPGTGIVTRATAGACRPPASCPGRRGFHPFKRRFMRGCR